MEQLATMSGTLQNTLCIKHLHHNNAETETPKPCVLQQHWLLHEIRWIALENASASPVAHVTSLQKDAASAHQEITKLVGSSAENLRT